jgi:protein-tyrosine-phosphatase
MAEGFMRYFLGLHGLTGGWNVSSSGVMAIEGLPAAELAIRVMSEHGIDISEHRSRPVSALSPSEGSLVLGMTREHVSRMKTLLPDRGLTICLLGEASRPFYGGEAPEVPDPFGSGLSRYREVAAIIRAMTLNLACILGSG